MSGEPFTLYSPTGRAYRVHSYGPNNIVMTRYLDNGHGALRGESSRPASVEEHQMFEMMERAFAQIVELERSLGEALADLGEALALAPELAAIPLDKRAERLRRIMVRQSAAAQRSV
jgi:hypothetical protein